jgi:transposase
MSIERFAWSSPTAEIIGEAPLRHPRRGEPAGGFSHGRFRRWRRSRQAPHSTPPISWAVIPQGRREKRTRSFDGGLYEECNRVERLVGHLKQFRRIATRYEKSAESYLPMLTLAGILLWL